MVHGTKPQVTMHTPRKGTNQQSYSNFGSEVKSTALIQDGRTKEIYRIQDPVDGGFLCGSR